MRVFHCSHCQNLLFFESNQCLNCGRILAFLPDLQIIGSLDPAAKGDSRIWSFGNFANVRNYRLCDNYIVQNNCNWAIPVSDPNTLCQSCRLTRTVPDINRPGFKEAWYKLEIAKRRLVYSLKRLGCFVKSMEEDPRGVAFDFLPDPENPEARDAHPVLSGHANGTITINIAEADDAERERRRVQLHEPYRTLLGHFRHESGHYYWDRLIGDMGKSADNLDTFRGLFGDERTDYDKALQAYYKQGPPSDWQQHFVTPYSSAHPWEDWAETWAHYLHMVDALETAAACGLKLDPPRPDEPALTSSFDPTKQDVSFEKMIDRWFPLTYLLNNLNRGLGLLDAYPFVLAPRAIEKLAFVHDILRRPMPGPSGLTDSPVVGQFEFCCLDCPPE